MLCKYCNIEMIDGVAMLPVWGNYRNRFQKGSTLYHIGAQKRKVKKCPDCGHSVSFHPELTGNIHNCNLGKYIEVHK